MAKEIKFNVRIAVDGKEQLVTATSSVADLRRVMEEAKGSAGQFRDQLLAFTQSVQKMQQVSSSITQIAGTLNNATAESRSFGAAMKAANTMAGKDAAGFKVLKGQVAELAADIPIARDALANGLYQVISNGVPENNWINYLETSARSAIGGIADVGEVVKVTSTIIKNYGLEWEAAQDIQDKIQLTAKNGVTSFEQLAAALPSVTGQAAQLGVSFTEMLAVMSTLTGVTGNTSEVATQLSSVLTALTKESSKAQKMAEAMGIEFNAASIKAAGGLRNYLQELDKTITAYAEKSGELKESIYAKLFGRAEALRLTNALTGQLAEKFDENIQALENSAGTMAKAYDDMASTGASKLQMLKNYWSQYTDHIASLVSGLLPVLNFSAQAGMTATSILTITKQLQTLNLTLKLTRIETFRAIAAYALFGTNSRKVAAAMHVMAQSFRSAQTAAIASRIAIRGLLAATGIGIAVVALTTIIGKLVTSLSDAGDAAEDTAEDIEALKEADEAFKSKFAETETALKERTENLKKLIDAKKNTADAVKALADEYPTLVNAQMSAADAYKALINGSKTYCTQLALEAKAHTLKAKIADVNAQKETNAEKKRRLIEEGKATRQTWGLGSKWGANGKKQLAIVKKTVDTDEYAELKKSDKALEDETVKLQAELDATNAAAARLKETVTETGTDGVKSLKVAEMTLQQVKDALEENEKKGLKTTDPTELAALKKSNAELKARKAHLEKLQGLDTKSGGTHERKIIADPKTLEELRTNIDLTKKKLTDADTAEQRQLRSQIQAWQKKADAIELAQKKAALPVGSIGKDNKVDVTKIETEADAKGVTEYLNKVKSLTTEKEKIAELDRQILAVELRQAEIQRPTNDVLQSLYSEETIKVNVEQGKVNLPEIPADDKVIKVNVEQGDVNLPQIPADDKVIKVNVEQGSVNLPQIPADDKVIKVNVEQGKVDMRPVEMLQAIDKELNYQRALRKAATAEEQKQIDARIGKLETLKSHVENAGVIAMPNEALQNYDQLNIKLNYYRDLLKTAFAANRPEILQHIKDLEEIEARWQAADKAATVNIDIKGLNTLKEIDAAISFYSERQQTEDAAQIQKTQVLIDRLTQKKTAIQLGVEIPSMQKEVAEINALTGREYTLKIKSMGFDAIADKVREITKLMQNPDISKGQKQQLAELRESYLEWAKDASKSFSTYRQGWDGVKGIGGGIENITNALEGNGSAWEKATAVVDGFLQIYDGISSVVEMVNTLTAATNLQTAAKTQETTATAMNTAAVATETTAIASDTAAAATNTAVKSGQAIAGATASGASMPFPYNLIAIAAGIAAVIAALSMISGFATGGVVGGNSPTGDRVLARVNSGEMILNKRQQQRLLYILNGGALSAGLTPAMPKPQRVDLNVNALQSQLKPYEVRVSGSLKGRGRDLLVTIENEQNHNKRS